jgi:hypothetical protein
MLGAGAVMMATMLRARHLRGLDLDASPAALAA